MIPLCAFIVFVTFYGEEYMACRMHLECAKRTNENTIECCMGNDTKKRNWVFAFCACGICARKPLHSLSFHSSLICCAEFDSCAHECCRNSRVYVYASTDDHISVQTIASALSSTLFCCLLLISTISLNLSLE